MTAEERARQKCEGTNLAYAQGIIQGLLETHAREAVEAEREACAVLVEFLVSSVAGWPTNFARNDALRHAAGRIRARGDDAKKEPTDV